MVRLHPARKLRNQRILVVRCLIIACFAGALVVFPVRNLVSARQSGAEVTARNASDGLHATSSSGTVLKSGSNNERTENMASIWAPYWKLGDGFDSMLLINNVQPRSLVLRPLVYAADGTLLPANPVSLDSLESKRISLRDIIGVQHGEGQIGFSFEGMSMDVVAQIVIANEAQHVSFNHVLMAPMGKTSRLEGVYYVPSRLSSLEFALANVGEQPIEAKMILTAGMTDLTETSVTLAPHSTQTVRPTANHFAKKVRAATAMGVTIQHNGSLGALMVQGMVSTLPGYSTNIRLVDPGELKSNRLISPIASLDRASAMLVARNIGEESLEVVPTVHYVSGDETRSLNLDAQSLAPGQSSALNINRQLRSLPVTVASVAVELTASRASSLVADLLLLDGARVRAVQVTPKDSDGESAPAYDYPWQVGPKVDTIISLTNPSQSEDLKYSLFIFYGQGHVYSFPEHVLRPGEARQVSVRDVITNKIPDDLGTVIPPEFTFGQAKAMVHGKLQKSFRLLGESIIMDAENRVAATLSCPTCPPNPSSLAASVSSVIGDPGDLLNVNWLCYFADNTFMVNPIPLFVLTDDLNVATYYLGSYQVQFSSAGQTTLWGHDDECGWRSDGETCFCDVPIALVAALTVQVRGCGDQRDTIIREYRTYNVNLYPRCADFTQTAHSAHFSFAELNGGDYAWAIIRDSLLTGLECVRTANGNVPLTINSGYRNPAHNAAVGGVPQSRHMYGDAADIASSAGTWQALHDAGKSCGACVEPQNVSGAGHVHVDWRGGCPPGY